MLNRPSPRLAILCAELARESVALRCERIMYASSAHHPRVNRAPPPVAADMPLPPSYDEDLAEWLECLKGKSNSEIAAFEDWLLRVRPSGCVEQVENAWLESSDYGEWFSDHLGASGPKRCAKAASKKPQPAAPAYAVSAESAGQKPTHSVCIKRQTYMYYSWNVGHIVEGPYSARAFPEYWRACDPDGWIPHTVMPDSACPVPAGVAYEARYRDGQPVASPEAARSDCCESLWRIAGGCEEARDIVAWRPVAGGAA